MKITKAKYLLSAMLIAACSLGFTACGDDNNDDNGGNGGNGGGATTSATISSNEGSASYTHAFFFYSNVDSSAGSYGYEIEFSDFDFSSYIIANNWRGLPKKASIASLYIVTKQKATSGLPTGTFTTGSWAMSGAFNVPLVDGDYEIQDGAWYFDATEGSVTISKSGDIYKITIDPLKAAWKKRQGSSDDEYTKTSSFVFKGKINDLTSYRDSGDDDDDDDED